MAVTGSASIETCVGVADHKRVQGLTWTPRVDVTTSFNSCSFASELFTLVPFGFREEQREVGQLNQDDKQESRSGGNSYSCEIEECC